jgi:exoribonuclease R
MLNPPNGRRKGILERIARRVMKERGFLADFSRTALNELEKIQQDDWGAESPREDLRQLLWASIDNDDSLDLDSQLKVQLIHTNIEKGFIDFKKVRSDL